MSTDGLDGACGCRFCSHANDTLSGESRVETVVASTRDFVAWPSVGSLVAGWLLVVPRRHHLALAQLLDEELRDLDEFVDGLRHRLMSTFNGHMYSFEHGPAARGISVGCSIDHAHMHLVPLDFDLAVAARSFEPQFTWQTGVDLRSLRPRHSAGESYLWLRSPDGSTMGTTGGALPSQYFRRVIAETLGLGEPDWRLEPRPQVAGRTVSALSAQLVVSTPVANSA
jgi:diadenosine tetraphosphate (Ap4A) HIT family hydrolase